MRPLEVDVTALEGLAVAAQRLGARLAAVTAPASAALRAEPGRSPLAAGHLLDTVRASERAVSDLRSLAAVVSLVAHVYRGVERSLSAAFGPGSAPWSGEVEVLPPADLGALTDLLAELPADELEGLLVNAPELARQVVDEAGAVGAVGAVGAGAVVAADAAGLEALLASSACLPLPTAADRVHTFLARLPARQVQLLALLRPALMVRARSAPTGLRFAASRVLVAADLARLLRRLSWTVPGARQDDWGRQVAQRREWLHGSVVLRHPDGTTTRRRHQLLSFDPRGDGTVVEVVGDLRRARHLAVFVPGTGSDLVRYPGSFARVVPFAAADPSLAMVLWQGADHPDQPFDDGILPVREHVLAAAFRDAADVAGPVLAADVAGLTVAQPDATRDLTVLGHSYGGSVVGAAESAGLVADRIVHVASAGAYVDHLSGYPGSAAGTQRFSMTAYDDPIRLAQGHDLGDANTRLRSMGPPALDPVDGLWAPLLAGALRRGVGDPGQVGHGLDPDLLPRVVRLDLGVDGAGRPVGGHSGMFAPGSTAWRNLLATMTAGRVQVLEPGRWASHLEPAASLVSVPHYVVDRTPWSDPTYRPPVLDLA